MRLQEVLFLLEAHRAIESLTLDGPSTTLKDEDYAKIRSIDI